MSNKLDREFKYATKCFIWICVAMLVPLIGGGILITAGIISVYSLPWFIFGSLGVVIVGAMMMFAGPGEEEP